MKKNNICIYDTNNDGHHWFYNYTLISKLRKNYNVYYYTSNLNKQMIKILLNENINFNNSNFKDKGRLTRYIYEIKNILKMIRYCKKNKINRLLIMHLDSNIVWLYLFYWLFIINKIKIIGVQHWFPNNRVKKIIYRILAKKITIIVHTKDVFYKTNIITKNIDNLKIVNYPVRNVEFIDSKIAKLKLGINNKNFTLLYFGGTRIDKGIDILINSLKHISKDLNLIIAGKEEYFKKNYILNEVNKYKNIKLILNLNFIKEEDIKYYFNSCDCVVIPYKNYFNGESGIFTEAINYGKPVIAPDIIHFPEIIKKKNNGIVFKVEDCYDLAKKIISIKDNIEYFKSNAIKYQNSYRIEHSVENFINQYDNILRGLK